MTRAILEPPVMVSLGVSVRGSYNRLKAGFRNSFNFVINNVTRVPEARFQAPVTPSERHMERKQKIPKWPASWGPPRNLLVSLLVSLRGSNHFKCIMLCIMLEASGISCKVHFITLI
jgi:hypothetical protein